MSDVPATRLGRDDGPAPEASSAPVEPAGAFRYTVDDAGLAQVVLDVPGKSVNTFDARVIAELESLLEALAGDAGVTVATFSSGKAKGFIAGADLAEIEGVLDLDDARRKVVRGQRAFQRLATLPFPTLAVIGGSCLGGGLEMALACTHRIAALDAELGLPEVQLGIIPGWGGTQRLPRLVGPRAAIDLICSARRVSGRDAARIGLVDRVSPAHELRERGLAFAREIAGTREAAGVGLARSPRKTIGSLRDPHPGRRRGREAGAGSGGGASGGFGRRPSALARLQRLALEANPTGRRVLFAQARKKILAKTGGHYPAPLRALTAIEEGLQGSLEAGLALEARIVSELLVSPVSKNLVHVFGLFEGVRKSPWARAASRERLPERAAVLGAGVMGGGIACLLASAGIWVRLKDLESARVGQGLRAAREVLEKKLRRRKLDAPGLRRAMNRIAGTTDDTGLGRVDLVIEAIVEDLEIKKRAFARLDALAPAHAILATNTSSLPVGEIGSAVRDPSRVAGLHFFNPVDRMPLVEIVRARETSDATLAALYGLALALDKKPVVVKDAPGFLVNRILMPYLNEAAHLYDEGLEASAIDDVMTAFGMPVGPLALLDDIGLDVAQKVGRILAGAFPQRMEPAPLFERLHETGRTGRKGGRGFYLYEEGDRKAADSSLRTELEGAVATAPDFSSQEIERRLIYPMIDEAARCLAEGVVATPEDVDLAMIAGTGFPPFRGGLLHHADIVGVEGVVTALERLASAGAARLAPSAALRETAARGGFYAAPPAGET
jgi:3-hydroxyacyl-CoA dehydrogenase/enoyl-CoA hydratase/3-hydroxybutyryl-CoA epimerase